jgi:hypothetical protein
MICAYEECNKKFESKTHNQKYCSDECCRTATNLKIKEKYYKNKDRLRGKIRYCISKECNIKLSRYNESDTCTNCESGRITKERKELLDVLKNVFG